MKRFELLFNNDQNVAIASLNGNEFWQRYQRFMFIFFSYILMSLEFKGSLSKCLRLLCVSIGVEAEFPYVLDDRLWQNILFVQIKDLFRHLKSSTNVSGWNVTPSKRSVFKDLWSKRPQHIPFPLEISKNSPYWITNVQWQITVNTWLHWNGRCGLLCNRKRPACVAQWWVCQTHDLVAVSSIPGWGRHIFASHHCKSMSEK